MPYRPHWRLRLNVHRLLHDPARLFRAATRWVGSEPHAGPVDPPFARHDALRLWTPHLSATVIAGLDLGTGRFVTAEQVDGNMRVAVAGEVRSLSPAGVALVCSMGDDPLRYGPRSGGSHG